MVGRSMVRNMGIAAELGYLQRARRHPRRHQEDRQPARRRARPHLHRLPGRADGGPVADGQPRAPHRRRPGRHRAAREQPHPRQRERRLPHHQRPDAPRRQRRAQGQRQGARLRPRERRRAALLLQHRQAAQRPAGARRVAAHVRQRPARHPVGRARATTSCSPRTASSSTSSTGVADGRPVSSTCGYVYVDGSSVGGADEALLKDRRILRDEGFITCIVVLDAATGKIASGPGDHGARASSRTRRSSSRSSPRSSGPSRRPSPMASATTSSSSRSSGAPSARGSAARSVAAR